MRTRTGRMPVAWTAMVGAIVVPTIPVASSTLPWPARQGASPCAAAPRWPARTAW
jgi:hypothetical protein